MSKLKVWILAYLSRFLVKSFGLITEDDILQIKAKDQWITRGRSLLEGEIKNLKSEAEIIERMQLWKLIVNEVKWHGQKKAILDAMDSVGLISARELLYLSAILESFVKNIKSK